MNKKYNKIWKQFNKKSVEQRIETIIKENILSNQKNVNDLSTNANLNVSMADSLSENVIGTFSLPFSVAPFFLIDGHNYTVPMVTEEPSVVAACSYAAKLISLNGGFKSTVHNRKMTGQVVLYDIPNIKEAISEIEKNKLLLLQIANNAHPSIVKRNGGAENIYVKEFQDKESSINFLTVYIIIDTKEAMGANIVNTMAESLKVPLENITKGKSLFAILSNYATDALITVSCSLSAKTISKEVAKKIELASKYAKIDKYRATTHNKGIFNGIDAVAIATGNDWRAIEAGGHSFTIDDIENVYKGLTTWIYDNNTEELKGTLTLPMHVGTVGGSIGFNQKTNIALDLLGNPSAKQLSVILVAVGLAQNFAALKALVSDGIQKGHMKLHARILAIQAGATQYEVPLVINKLIEKNNPINLENVKKILEDIRSSYS